MEWKERDGFKEGLRTPLDRKSARIPNIQLLKPGVATKRVLLYMSKHLRVNIVPSHIYVILASYQFCERATLFL